MSDNSCFQQLIKSFPYNAFTFNLVASLEINCNFKYPSIRVYFSINIDYEVCVATVVVTC